MTIDDVLNGARMAFTFFIAYINTIAQEIGMEKTINALTNMCETMGPMLAQMWKEQAGVEEIDAKGALSVLTTVIEGIGIKFEVEEDTPQRVSFKDDRCPIYEAAQIMGLDSNAIENLCRRGVARFMDTACKQLNPNLNHELKKFRSAPDDFCIEVITLEK